MAVILTSHFYNQLEREIEMLQGSTDLFQKTERKKRRAPIDHEDYIVIKAHIVNNMARLFIDNQDGTFTYLKVNDDHTVSNELRDLVPNIVQQNVSFVRQKQKPPIKLKLPNGQSKRVTPGLERRVTYLEQRIAELDRSISIIMNERGLLDA
jgi:hypothetical protein